MSEKSVAGKTFDRRLIMRLLPYAKPYKVGFSLAVIGMLCGSALELVGPLLTRKAIDKAIPEHDFALLGWLVVGFLASTAFGHLFRYFESQVSTYCGQKVVWDIRKRVFSHLQYHDVIYKSIVRFRIIDVF